MRTARQYSIGTMPVAFVNRRREELTIRTGGYIVISLVAGSAFEYGCRPSKVPMQRRGLSGDRYDFSFLSKQFKCVVSNPSLQFDNSDSVRNSTPSRPAIRLCRGRLRQTIPDRERGLIARQRRCQAALRFLCTSPIFSCETTRSSCQPALLGSTSHWSGWQP
jgi:hypothetical protein